MILFFGRRFLFGRLSVNGFFSFLFGCFDLFFLARSGVFRGGLFVFGNGFFNFRLVFFYDRFDRRVVLILSFVGNFVRVCCCGFFGVRRR